MDTSNNQEIKETLKKKVFVIGLDGATFDLIKPWAEQGKLPNLAKLMMGVHGYLKSTIPPVTSPAWPSFMSGKNPGKHGVFEFLKKKDGITTLVSYRDIRAKCIWDLLGDNGKKSIVINVPVTYPPPQINGIVISGMLTPIGEEYTQPSHIAKELEDNLGEYIVDLDKETLSTFHKKASLDRLYHMTKKRKDATLYLMKKYNYDFCIVIFKGTDMICHRLWKRQDKILEFYQKIDEYIGELLQNIDPWTNIIIISDHGFGTINKTFHINKWLEDLGLIKREKKYLLSYYDYSKSDEINKIREKITSNRLSTLNKFLKEKTIEFMLKSGITLERADDWLLKLRLGFLKGFIPISFYTLIPHSKNINIDWNKTKAYFYSPESHGIVINLKGREPHGIVESGREYEELRDFIIQELHKLKDPETGEKIMENIFKKEELYSGPYLDNAPDIIFITKDMQYKNSSRYSDSLITANTGGHGHKLNGILIAKGPDIKENKKIEGAELIDIAPTILHIMGVPVPSDMDGKVLKEIFKEDSELAKREIVYHEVDEKEKLSKKIKDLKAFAKI